MKINGYKTCFMAALTVLTAASALASPSPARTPKQVVAGAKMISEKLAQAAQEMQSGSVEQACLQVGAIIEDIKVLSEMDENCGFIHCASAHEMAMNIADVLPDLTRGVCTDPTDESRSRAAEMLKYDAQAIGRYADPKLYKN